MKKATQCVHAGTYYDPVTGGINTPVFISSAFDYIHQEDVPYPRYFNTPNQKVVVNKMCALEGAEAGILFSSGMAAISAGVLSFAGSGDHVVMMDELYGGTHAFATDEWDRLGIAYTFTETDADAICRAVTDRTTVIVIESPTNPLLSAIDIKKVADFAKEHGIVTIIDNTFATPINQNPIQLGIDIVVHSGTKYLGGHSDMCCGVLLASAQKTRQVLKLARFLGGSLNAMMCYLLERSLKTLALRVNRQSENALTVSRALEGLPGIRQVYYPGLASSPYIEVARSQMRAFGAMLSFDLEEGIDPDGFVGQLTLIKPAVSLGGVETTICSPAVTSHSKMSAEERQRVGISDALLRLSVGIEDAQDLIDDLTQALQFFR